MSNPFAHFHASAAAPAAVVTWEEAERATAAALMQDPSVSITTWNDVWDGHVLEYYPAFHRTTQSYWSCRLYYRRRFYLTQHIMADLADFQTDAARDYILSRLTDLELTHIRELIRMRHYEGAWVERVMAEVRRRLTPAQLERQRTTATVTQSNVGSVLNPRLGNMMMNRITELAGMGPILSLRNTPVLQRARMAIDRLRRDRTGTMQAHARALILKLIETILPYPDEDTWDRIFAYLTPQELHAMNQEVLYYVSDYESDDEDAGWIPHIWVPQWIRPERLHHFAQRLQMQMHRLRTERANLAASGLIQWLARRDGDAARHLSTFVTRTVNPSRAAAHTHITTQPGQLVRAMMARVALRKRQAAAQAAAEDPDAIARRTRSRKDEEKHSD